MSRFSMDWSELSLQVMITFGHFLWQACVVGMLLAIVEQAFEMVSGWPQPLRSFETTPDVSRRSANFRYATACIAFFSLPICVVATFGWVHQSRGAIMLGIGDRMESPSSPMVSANEAIPTMANTDISVLPPPVTSTHAEVSATKRIEFADLCCRARHHLCSILKHLRRTYCSLIWWSVSCWLDSYCRSFGSSRLRQPSSRLRMSSC